MLSTAVFKYSFFKSKIYENGRRRDNSAACRLFCPNTKRYYT